MSVTITADVECRAGIALVTAHVHNPTSAARQVRIANRLDGPVLAPRRRGIPESGWDDDGATVVVEAEDATALGYACPLEDRAAADPPAELVSVADPVDESETLVSHARRELGEFRPPRDALPVVSPRATGTDEDAVDGDSGGPHSDHSNVDEDVICVVEELPDVIANYLADAEKRIERAERLTDASVPEATAALVTGDRTPSDLAVTVEADAKTLSLIAERASQLGSRAEETDVQTDALRRLA